MKDGRDKYARARIEEETLEQFKQAVEKKRTTQSEVLYKFIKSYIKRVMK